MFSWLSSIADREASSSSPKDSNGNTDSNQTSAESGTPVENENEPLTDPLSTVSTGLDAIGSFFTSIGSTLAEAIVEEANEFLDEKRRCESEGLAPVAAEVDGLMPPWEDFEVDNQELADEVCKQIMSLPKSKRNFMEAPPPEAEFDFDFDQMLPLAQVCLRSDPNLERMRFYLVPQFIREPQFWRNYFYRVKIIKEAYGMPIAANPLARNISSSSNKEEENSERNSLATPAENSHQSATHLVNEIAPQQQDETPETLPNSTSEDQKKVVKEDDAPILINSEDTFASDTILIGDTENEYLQSESVQLRTDDQELDWEAQLKAELEGVESHGGADSDIDLNELETSLEEEIQRELSNLDD